MFIGLFLFAAEFGRITGRVTDSETGEPLIGADVIVEGTELGAATDENGEYTVLYVPVGSHKVISSYISYDPFTYTSVVVNADQTTVLNFRLRPTVIEVKGVTVVAEREMIVVSKTGTDRAVTSQEMDRLPVTTINQVITLQAGVVESDLGTHLRGGRTDEITYFVDGIMTKVPNTGWQSVRVNPNAVEEVTVVSGGFDAEYGDALSGVVNIVTKEGGTKHSGTVKFLTDEVFSSWEQINYGYNKYDISLGGPLPVSKRLRYFVSGELMMTDAFEEALYKATSPRIDYRTQARFSYLFPNAKGKITFSGFRSREQYVVWSPYLAGGNRVKYLEQKPMSRIKNWILSTTFNYMLTAKTLTSLKIGATHFERCYGNRDYQYEEDSGRTWYGDYRFYAEHILDDLVSGDVVITDWMIDTLKEYHEEYQNRDVLYLRNSPYATEGRFYTYGDYRVWRFWHNDDYQGRFDITHSVGKVHEFKTGLDFIQYNMKYFDNNLPWVTNPFWDYYDRDPYKVAFYAQDKMDFEGLIARIGLRFDYFDPKAVTYADPGNALDSTLVEAESNYKVSPRLGFSLPVTDRMKFRFNYGHYFQLPQLDDMYGTTDTAVIRLALSRGNTIVGNILIKPQKTVMYEVGIENQLSDDIAFGFTAYFKDIYDLSQIREVQALPIPYFQYFNVDYGNVKGFEFNLKKRMSNMWALGLTYTLQFAKGTAAYAGEWYYDHYNYQIDPPVIDYWLDFDERHTVNANFDVDFPKDFFLFPLQQLASSIVFSYHSGQPYTPEDLRGNKLGDENSARMPGFWNVDWNFSRRVKVGPVNLILSGMIYNLFNTQQVDEVYVTTGRADDHGDPEPGLGQFGYLPISSSRYSPQADYNHDGLLTPVELKQDYIQILEDYYNDPTNYLNPFRVRLGVGLGF
jgi:outer membrane receptor protein involved in Fe transport